MGQAAGRANPSNGRRRHDLHTADCYVRTGGADTRWRSDYRRRNRRPDDVCAVCWERLEWVAIGGCGHPGVCAECTVRLRFVHGDHRCCICRKHCETVAVTKGGGEGAFAKMLAGRPAVCKGVLVPPRLQDLL